MKSEHLLSSKQNTDNSGFSIVELIIAVAILAAVFTPILRSFALGAKTNAKAQQMQNVTSVAEKIMEEVKAYSIEELYTKAAASAEIVFLSGSEAEAYIDSGSNAEPSSESSDYDDAPYVLYYKDITATQGKTYNVCATINNKTYDVDTATDASNINSVKLPQLYDVQDSKDHLVLSWEMSKFDPGALNNLVEANTKEDSQKDTVKNEIKSKGVKTTTIEFDNAADGKSADITCNVKYESGDSTKYPKTLEYNVYSGTLETIEVDDKNNGGPHAYLFYMMSPIANDEYLPHEVINIVEKNKPADVNHNVYLMLQNDGNLEDLKYSDGSKAADIEIQYNGTTLVKRDGDSDVLTQDDMDTLEANSFYTNLTSSNRDLNDKLYDEKRKNRVYEVKVTVCDGTDSLTELVSSMNAGNEAK